jgi:hypothetical protein
VNDMNDFFFIFPDKKKSSAIGFDTKLGDR